MDLIRNSKSIVNSGKIFSFYPKTKAISRSNTSSSLKLLLIAQKKIKNKTLRDKLLRKPRFPKFSSETGKTKISSKTHGILTQMIPKVARTKTKYQASNRTAGKDSSSKDYPPCEGSSILKHLSKAPNQTKTSHHENISN